MSAIYEAIGRLVVGFIRARYQKQLRIAAGVAATSVAAAVYLVARRDVEEG